MKILGDSSAINKIPPQLLSQFKSEIYIVDPLANIPEDIPRDRCIGVVERVSNFQLVEIMFRTSIAQIIQTEGDFEEQLYLAAMLLEKREDFYSHGLIAHLQSDEFSRYRIASYEEFPFCAKSDKKGLFRFINNQLGRLGKSNTVRSDLELIVDELFTNAIYNAPVQEEFGGQIQDRHDKKVIRYSKGKKGRFRFASNDSFVFVECSDPYGSLNPLDALSKIRKSYHVGVGSAINMKACGGAGIGGRLVYEACVCYYMLIKKGEITTICCILPYGISLRKKELLTKNINVLFSGGSMSDFSYTELSGGERHIIKFSGHINEDSVLSKIDLSGKKIVEFDFQDIVGVNSCGIREWIKWLSTHPKDLQLIWTNCPSEIIDQINMVEGFLPANGRVESFYVPYFCDNCDNRTNILMKVGAGGEAPECQEEINCSNCDKKAEIDIIESKYFKFLER